MKVGLICIGVSIVSVIWSYVVFYIYILFFQEFVNQCIQYFCVGKWWVVFNFGFDQDFFEEFFSFSSVKLIIRREFFVDKFFESGDYFNFFLGSFLVNFDFFVFGCVEFGFV